MKDVGNLRVYVSFTEKELEAIYESLTARIIERHRDFAENGTISMYFYLKEVLLEKLKDFKTDKEHEQEEREEALEEINDAKDEIGDALDRLINRVKDLIGR